MIYQSMSGDAAQGKASFAMNGGSLTNANGDIFFVNNTTADISLSNAEIINNDASGNFLRAAAAGWGREGSNGGHVNMYAKKQPISGNMLVDGVSTLNLYLDDASSFQGAINPDGQEGEVYVEIKNGSVWKLSADSYITSLTCEADSIDLNGHTLYVSGEAYKEGTASQGEAVETVVSSDGSQGGMPDGQPPEKPPGDGSSHGQPPEKPPGDGFGGGEPPARPEDQE